MGNFEIVLNELIAYELENLVKYFSLNENLFLPDISKSHSQTVEKVKNTKNTVTQQQSHVASYISQNVTFRIS